MVGVMNPGAYRDDSTLTRLLCVYRGELLDFLTMARFCQSGKAVVAIRPPLTRVYSPQQIEDQFEISALDRGAGDLLCPRVLGGYQGIDRPGSPIHNRI
ncbi:MAG: hypothetical protein NVSMB68_10930 [Thermoanaerobaculia bacterium]